MIKSRVLLAAIGIGAVVSVPAILAGQAPSTPNRPAWVAEEAWVPLTPELGFVMTEERTAPGATRLNPVPTPIATGYFTVRIGGVWRRAAMEQLPMRVPAH